jgi:DNA-binding CsgD family transcriptional regulator
MKIRGKSSRTAALPQIMDLIYQAAVEPRDWPSAVTEISDAVGARAVSLTITDPEGKAMPFVIAPRTDPEWLRVYIDRWATSNLVREEGKAFAVGRVYQFEDFAMPRAEFEQTAFYGEFWAPQQMNAGLLVNAMKEGDAVGVVGFYRSSREGPFEPAEERLLHALAPHLRRAMMLNLHIGRLELQRSATAEMLNHCEHGAILVDAQARVLFANSVAEDILREGVGLRVKEGCLGTAAAMKTAALRRMIAGGSDGADSDTLTVTRPDGGDLSVLVLPVKAESTWLAQPAAAIVFVKDAQANGLPSHEHLQRLFGLTPAQAALACQILHGDGIQAAADRLGISRATARTHLLEVFQKTGTNRQAELVRVILQRSFTGSRGGD